MRSAVGWLFAFGCGSKEASLPADACERFIDKSRATLAELGVPYTPAIEATTLRDCKVDIAAGKPMVLVRCVLDAADARTCFPTYDQMKEPK